MPHDPEQLSLLGLLLSLVVETHTARGKGVPSDPLVPSTADSRCVYLYTPSRVVYEWVCHHLSPSTWPHWLVRLADLDGVHPATTRLLDVDRTMPRTLWEPLRQRGFTIKPFSSHRTGARYAP